MRTLKFKSCPHNCFFAAVNHNYDHKQRTLKHRSTQNGSKSTNHKLQTLTFWSVKVKFCFLRGPWRWLTAAKNAIVSWLLNFRIRMFDTHQCFQNLCPLWSRKIWSSISFQTLRWVYKPLGRKKHIQNSQQFSYRTRVRNLKFPQWSSCLFPGNDGIWKVASSIHAWGTKIFVVPGEHCFSFFPVKMFTGSVSALLTSAH